MSAYDKYQQAWGIESGLKAGKAFLDRFVPRVLGNPLVRGALNNPIVRVGGGLASKAFSLPAQLVVSELAQSNPWGNKDSAMYGKGPGSLEYEAALQNATASGRTRPIEEDYLITPAVSGSTFNTSSEPYIDPLSDEFGDRYPAQDVTNSQFNEPAKAFLDAKTAWLADTANSPAARAGIDPDARWKTYLGNQAWRKDRGRSYNTDLDAYLKPSSENKRHWNVFGNEMIMDDNKIPVTQKVDNFIDNVPADVVAANIAKNDADKAKVNSGEMTAAEYFGTNIR